MGLSTKPTGKFKSLLVKLENEAKKRKTAKAVADKTSTTEQQGA